MAKIVQGYSFPDDATPEEIQKALASVRPQKKAAVEDVPPEPKEMSWGEYGKGLGRSAAAGLTFNWSDEAIAAARAKIEGISFDEALADERAKKKQFEEQYPVAAIAAEIGGGLPTMAIPGLGIGRVAQTAQTAGRIAKTLNSAPAQMARTGAKQGALSGLGEAEGGLDAEGVASRLTGAAQGAGTGALVGGGLSVLGSVASPVVGAIAERVRPSISDRVAKTKILQDLERSGMTPEQALKEFEYLQSTGAKPSFFDVNPALTSRAESVANREGAAGQGIVEDIAERQRGQRDRIMGQAKDRLDQKGNYFDTADEAAEALRTKAKPFYDKAYKAEIPLEAQYDLQVIMNDLTQAFPEAVNYAKRLYVAERKGDDFKRLGTREMENGNEAFDMIPKVQQWDYIMRGLGQSIEKETDNVAGKVTQLGRAATMMRNEIASVLDGAVPDFAAARARYKGDLEVKQALEQARKGFSRVDPEELARSWGSMSLAEKEAYRAGALKNIRDSLFGSGDFRDATKRIGQEIRDRREALNIIMPEKTSAKLFQDFLEAEARLANNARRVKDGSPTARRLQGAKDLESNVDMSTLGIAGDVAGQRWGNLMGKVFNIVANNPAIPEKRVEAIGQMLRANRLDEVERLTNSLERFVQEQARRNENSMLAGKAVAGGAGRIAGERSVENPGEPIPELTIRP